MSAYVESIEQVSHRVRGHARIDGPRYYYFAELLRADDEPGVVLPSLRSMRRYVEPYRDSRGRYHAAYWRVVSLKSAASHVMRDLLRAALSQEVQS